jgi:hypothetical protein
VPAQLVLGQRIGIENNEWPSKNGQCSADAKASQNPQEAATLEPEPIVNQLRAFGDGWSVAQTTNFRFLHNQSREVVERAARLAELTRGTMQHKWFGSSRGDWHPRCDIYLHATGRDFSRAIGVPANVPGYSITRVLGSRVVFRRIDLHCDDPNMLVAVLPHEVTHVLMAGRFGKDSVPPWANEGMAVLAEPPDKIRCHLRNLARCREEGRLFQVCQLIQLREYPDHRSLAAFYAQSVALVEFLSREREPQVFTRFLCDSLQEGLERACLRHYGWRLAELEQRCQDNQEKVTQ